jgi:tellurite resistance protein TehA-like permease
MIRWLNNTWFGRAVDAILDSPYLQVVANIAYTACIVWIIYAVLHNIDNYMKKIDQLEQRVRQLEQRAK